jgi:hypothetical protein
MALQRKLFLANTVNQFDAGDGGGGRPKFLNPSGTRVGGVL